MYLLIERTSIAYEGCYTVPHGVFTDDALALEALEKLKEKVAKENNIKNEEWEKDEYRIGYLYSSYGGGYQVYLEEVIENKYVE